MKYRKVKFPEKGSPTYCVVDFNDNDELLIVNEDVIHLWEKASKAKRAEYYEEWIPIDELVKVNPKKNPQVKKWLGTKPIKCDVCMGKFTKNVFIDGKIRGGTWGLLCRPCHKDYGIGLGTGRGQMYDLTTLEKIDG